MNLKQSRVLHSTKKEVVQKNNTMDEDAKLTSLLQIIADVWYACDLFERE